MIMYGQMKKYKESLENMNEPIVLSQCSQEKLDLRGIMSYAKNQGKKVIELSDSERKMFISN